MVIILVQIGYGDASSKLMATLQNLKKDEQEDQEYIIKI
jgi:hypothetical protein